MGLGGRRRRDMEGPRLRISAQGVIVMLSSCMGFALPMQAGDQVFRHFDLALAERQALQRLSLLR